MIFAVEKKTAKKLQEERTLHKISLIDEHIACAFTGLSADARQIIDYARKESQVFRMTYDETPTVNYLARKISSVLQQFTQKGGARPFGISMMFGGIDPLVGAQIH